MKYNAHNKQSMFHNFVNDDEHRIVYFNGGRGSGKTTAGAIQSIMQAFTNAPGKRGVVIAPTYKLLKDASYYELKHWIPKKSIAYENKTDMIMQLHNGSEIAFRSADNPDNLRGPNRAWAWFDEPRNLRTNEAFNIVLGQMRDENFRIWLTSTPSGLAHWMYNVFVKNREDYIAVIDVQTKENPYVPQVQLDILNSQYTGEFKLQELEAKWVSFEGLIYPDFNSMNIDDTIKYNKDYKILWGADDGYATGHERVVLVGQVNNRGTLEILNEYSKTYQSYGQTIKDCSEFPKPDICAVGIDSPQFRDAFHNAGISTSPGNDSKKWNVENGIRKVRAMIWDGLGSRQLKIHPRCKNLILGIQSYAYKQGTNRPLKENDNEVDALRYMSRYV